MYAQFISLPWRTNISINISASNDTTCQQVCDNISINISTSDDAIYQQVCENCDYYSLIDKL